MAKFQIFTDSCSDLDKAHREAAGVEYCRMKCVIDGEEHWADLDWNEFKPETFYGWLAEGKHMKTTQVPYEEFVEKFTPLLEKGIDVLYIACSHKLTGSMNIFNLVKQELQEKFPDRKMIGVDSLNACVGEAMIVLDAAAQQKAGLSIEEVEKWVIENRNRYNWFATVETLTYIKNAGRIKGSKAVLGNIFHKKPIFISDSQGNNYTLGTVTGTKNADKLIVEGIVKQIEKDRSQRVIISQGMAQERAQRMKEALMEALNIEPEIWWIGPIIGTTCGPGVIVAGCVGKEVTIFEGDGKATPLDFSTLSE